MVMFMGKSTISIHGHEYYDEVYGVRITPIFLTSMFEQPDRRTGETRVVEGGRELKYSREENPTTRYLEKVIARLEEGEDAIAFNSGMGAITATLLSELQQGMKVIIPMESYSGTIALLNSISEKMNLKIEKIFPETEDILEAINGGADLLIIETITNPTLRVIDIREVAKACSDSNTKVIVDNTFATPILYSPLSEGASIVLESATKYLAGHNDVIGGVVSSNRQIISSIWEWRKLTGTIMQPFEAFLVQRGLKTLSIRFETHSKSAMAVAEFLQEHPKIEDVYYPGLSSSPYKNKADKLFKKKLYGGVVSFKVKGGRSSALSVLRRLKMIVPSPSFGGPESLLTYPVISASKYIPPEDRDRLGISDNLLRLSVGLEDVEDIIEDLDKALRTGA